MSDFHKGTRRFDGVEADSATVNGTTTTDALEADKEQINRTYQGVSGSRSVNTVETNNSGSDIIVSANIQSTSDGTLIGVKSEGNDFLKNAVRKVRTLDSGEEINIQFEVGSGDDYEVRQFNGVANSSITVWEELRP